MHEGIHDIQTSSGSLSTESEIEDHEQHKVLKKQVDNFVCSAQDANMEFDLLGSVGLHPVRVSPLDKIEEDEKKDEEEELRKK